MQPDIYNNYNNNFKLKFQDNNIEKYKKKSKNNNNKHIHRNDNIVTSRTIIAIT